ncbi:MAG: DUF3078 domain-containing protein [Bacteroidota bacterium]|nr:DUF3078 domain-containing protein [Bacteroidota bacterium]
MNNRKNKFQANTLLKVWWFTFIFLILPYAIMAQTDSLNLSQADSLRKIELIKVQVQEEQVGVPDSLVNALKLVKDYYNSHDQWDNENASLKLAIERLILYIENGPLEPSLELIKNYSFSISSLDTSLSHSELTYPLTDTSIQILKGQETDSLLLLGDSLMLKSLSPMGTVREVNSFTLATDSSILEASFIPDSLAAVEKLAIEEYMIIDDSIKLALDALVGFLGTDSVKIWFSNIAGDSVEIVLKDGIQMTRRFWLKNEMLDSIGLWMDAVASDRLLILMEDGLEVNRMKGKKYRDNFMFTTLEIDPEMKSVNLKKIETNPWQLGGIGQLLLSQVYLSNWAKGGQSSISILVRGDLNAKYSKDNLKWENLFRSKYGLVKYRDEGLRKNEDFWEISTTIGWKASKKWYYSFGFNLKSQFAKGYNYPNDSIIVSNIFSPGYLYTTAGFEYNPVKTTSVIFSPLTYRSTFVIDTTNIEHTKFGVPLNKRSKSELGFLLKAHHTYRIKEDISIENRLQFFADYKGFEKIDFDWELNFRLQLGPFFTFSVITHILYNTDVKFPVYDDAGIETGKEAKMQFKEWMGFGIAYKF